MSQTKTIRWVVAHEPVHLYERTARAFIEEVEKAGRGTIKVEMWSHNDYYERLHNGNKPNKPDLPLMFSELEEGKFDMMQTVVGQYKFVNNNFMALDLPFLFRDHDHVTQVLEGSIGKALLDSLMLTSNMKGLAFTYSGGYRVMGSKDPIYSVDDLKGKRIVSGHPAHFLTHRCMGAVPVKGDPGTNLGYDSLEGEEVDAVDTSYIRFLGNHILKTNHAMFMTCVAINKDTWNSFTEDEQNIISAAMTKVARLEREWSVQDAEEFERTAYERGVVITEITKTERDRLRASLEEVYQASQHWFAPGLVESIRNS